MSGIARALPKLKDWAYAIISKDCPSAYHTQETDQLQSTASIASSRTSTSQSPDRRSTSSPLVRGFVHPTPLALHFATWPNKVTVWTIHETRAHGSHYQTSAVRSVWGYVY